MSETTNPRVARIRDAGAHTCPRRMGELGPWSRSEGVDRWHLGTWAATRHEADAEVADFMAPNPRGSIGKVLWCYPGEQPRTCSFCGGAHPDDVMALMEAGWEVGGTDKSYKRYLNPPGSREHTAALHAHHERWMDAIEANPDAEDVHALRGEYPKPKYPSPIPPVKVYVQHFTQEQVDRFNAMLRRRAATTEGGATTTHE